MQYGTVVQFFPEKGFGFIRPDFAKDDRADVFFHVTALGACVVRREIPRGQPVKYELPLGTKPVRRRRRDAESDAVDAREKPRAIMVELIDRLPGATLVDPTEKMVRKHPRARRRKPTWRR